MFKSGRMSDQPHFSMARRRVERAMQSLPDGIANPADHRVDVVVVSRLIVALNSIASGLSEAAREGLVDPSVIQEAADILWSVGEQAGIKSDGLRMLDDARPMELRSCLRAPIPEIFEVASQLSEAVDAHLAGDFLRARELLAQADRPDVRDWTDSIWGKYDPNIHRVTSRIRTTPNLPMEDRPTPRMPDRATQAMILERDGYHCRFCGIPVVPPEVRRALSSLYSDEVKWGRRNSEQHAGLQCLWLQFDHVLPNERGGTSDPENVVVTCAPCNFGRMQHTLEECELAHPLSRALAPTWNGYAEWDGLTRLLQKSAVTE